MSFAARTIGLYGKRWEFVGAGAVSTTTTANFPSTAQAGDLAVWCGSVGTSGTPPSGWTLIASGSTLQAYKVCAGGESSAYWQSTVGGSRAAVLLFRPVGGGAALTEGATDAPAVFRAMTAGSTPSLIVAIGNATSGAIWEPDLPGAWNNEINVTGQPALYASWRFMEPGEATGNMRIAARQTFGIFGIY